MIGPMISHRYEREEPRVLFFDTETTGKRRDYDQVVELAVFVLGDAAPKSWRFRPSMPIHPEAQKIHGLSAEILKDEPVFSVCVPEIRALFEGADILGGYHVAFDVAMLEYEFRRAGRALDLASKPILDPLRLWQEREPRQLQDAHRRFCGGDFAGAHGAAADVAATIRVLRGQLAAFGLEGKNYEEIADLCEPERRCWVGPSHHIQRRGHEVVFAFGKHIDRPVHEAVRSDRSYLKWMRSKDLPGHIMEICGLALALDGERFRQQVSDRYPQPGH